MIDPMRLVAVALVTGLVVGLVLWLAVAPLPRLAGRVRPYVPAARTALGATPRIAGQESCVFAPVLRSAGRWLSSVVDAATDDELALRLDQAGLFTDLAPDQRVAAYRARQLRSFATGVGAAMVGGWALGWRGAGLLGIGALGAVVGGTRQRGRIDRAIEERRDLMRIEVYSIDQLLALRIRAGGGVLQAVREVTARGKGLVVAELAEALVSVRAGTRPRLAFEHLAATTVEPHCARLYAALAAAEERGSDLAVVLGALAADVRRDRREHMRRRAVKRRAAMLLPIIALMAPVMLLFIIAPLPGIVLGGL